jgi:hypothetical protein
MSKIMDIQTYIYYIYVSVCPTIHLLYPVRFDKIWNMGDLVNVFNIHEFH